MPTVPVEGFSHDPQICRQCRGLCCRGVPGLWASPERFRALFFPGQELTPARLKEALPILGLEMRRVGNVPIPAPLSLETGCTFLGPEGCVLPQSQRPCQCLALAPELETLLDDTIHCRLPADFRTGRVRQRWQRFWGLDTPEDLSSSLLIPVVADPARHSSA